MTKLHAWEKTSLDSVPDTHPVLPLIASLLLGVAVLAGTSSAPAAACSAGLGVSMAISRSTRSAKQYDSIRKYGCYSISLDETLLAEYIRANGLEHTKAEIVWAQEQDLLISEACENLIDGTTEAMPQRLPPQLPLKSTVSPASPITDTNDQHPPQSPAIVPLVPQVVPIQPNSPPPSFDLIGEMSKAPENILIIAPSESGKGIVIGNLIAAFKASTDCSVTAIDPKGADTEGGFFAQCDRVHRFQSQLLGRDKIIAETKRGWKMFEDECIKWAGIKPCFILIDEMLVIGGCFKKAGDTFLQDKIASLVSMGRSQRQFCWIATQYPQLDKLGIDGGIAGQMELLMIARRKNINLLKGWVKYDLTKLVKFDDAVNCCDDSPVNRAVCWRNDWYPMPLMQNHSGYDRELNTWVESMQNNPPASAVSVADSLPDTSTAIANSPARGADTADSLTDTVSESNRTESELNRDVSGIASDGVDSASAINNFFDAVKNRKPKTLREIAASSRIKSTGASIEDIQRKLDYFVAEGFLISTDKGYISTDWEVEDFN